LPVSSGNRQRNPDNRVNPVENPRRQWPLLGGFLIPPVLLVVLILPYLGEAGKWLFTTKGTKKHEGEEKLGGVL